MTEPQRKGVALVLMKSPEADATISVLESDAPGARIADHGTYWHVSAPDEIVVDMARVGEELGHAIDLAQWLVVMSTYVGRIDSDPDVFRVTSRMLQLDPASSGS